MIDKWTCHICNKLRDDKDISVISKDVGEKFGLTPGVMTQNVRYCNDDKDCIEKSKSFEFIKKEDV